MKEKNKETEGGWRGRERGVEKEREIKREG